MTDRLVIDAETGDAETAPFTSEDQAERDARTPVAEQERVALEEAQANASVIDTAITAALAELAQLIAAPGLPSAVVNIPVIPDGTHTTATLSNYIRAMRDVLAAQQAVIVAQRDANQATRAGAQRVAQTLKQTIRLVQGDFDGID